MSGLRGTVYATRTIKTKNVIGIVFSLVVARSICALLTSSQAPASRAQAETDLPGKIVSDNSEFVSNTAPSSTVNAISPTSGNTSGGTFVTLTGTGLPAGVTTGGTSATNIIVVSSLKPWFVLLRYLVTRSFEENIVGSRGETGASTVWAKTP